MHVTGTVRYMQEIHIFIAVDKTKSINTSVCSKDACPILWGLS